MVIYGKRSNSQATGLEDPQRRSIRKVLSPSRRTNIIAGANL